MRVTLNEEEEEEGWWRNHGLGDGWDANENGGGGRGNPLAKDSDAFFKGRKKKFASPATSFLSTNAQRISLCSVQIRFFQKKKREENR